MSQWDSLLNLTGPFKDHLLGLYSDPILPVEVRQYLAPWIESQDWKLAARDPSLASVHFQNLLEHLDLQYNHFSQRQELLQVHNLRKFKYDIQQRYQETPHHLAEQIRNILQLEKNILLEAQEMENQNEQQSQVPMEIGQQYEIEQRVSKVKERIQSVDQEVKFLEEQQEIFDFRWKTFQTERSSNLPPEYVKKKTIELQVQLNELDRKRKEVLSQIKELLGLCETLHGFLQKELTDWLQRQKLECIGAGTDTCLKHLEGWITRTVEVFFHLRRLLRLLSDLAILLTYEGDLLKTEPETLQCRLHEMLCSLLQISFVVDKQPTMPYPCKRALVLKTSQQFSVRARLLVNLPELQNNMKALCTIDKNPPDNKGFRKFNLLGSSDKSIENVQQGGLMVEYKHLMLKEQKAGVGGKGSKGGPLSVIEELHNITFTTKFEYEGIELTLEAVTLPFVVISNLIQFSGAWASVLWFNLLSPDPKDVNFFSNPPAAPWSLLANALSWQFSCCTKRGLNKDQLQMLEKKLCGTVGEEGNAVTWTKFSKETMPRFSFTFWVWFDTIVALVKSHLENIWNDGHVMGFVSRSVEDSLLKTMQQGTFLLRFSESIRDGGITCSWVDHQCDGSYAIRSVQPYTKKELSHIPLTEIIRNYQLLAEENIPENPLKYLYPNVPKDDAFGEYYEQRSEITLEYQKYMKRRLIIVSERNIDDSQSSIASGTPQHSAETPQHSAETPQYDPDTPLSYPFQDFDALGTELVNQLFSSSLDPQNNIAAGRAQYFPEAAVHNYPPGTPHSSRIEDFLIDQSSDPMLSGLQGESSELNQDTFNAYQ
ncbi:signal transducer and activator of transcription 2 isoform X2 [Rana temporaria]|uniref:signal transducer and activator of transcription 2 isoform X2 n=1 Tax=Rana temporaria TaxID=8407 RepID=UPI001AADA5C2|nr:signal transducer and activator of transcription 2 isoform X2 [Rana temporaria]